MKTDGGFLYQSYCGREIGEHVHEVAKFRIRYFRDFPYLYEGNLEYEKKYLEAYSLDERSILIKVTDNKDRLLAVSTALPLLTPSNILDRASLMFSEIGLEPTEIFYYGEIILDYTLRGKGIARNIYNLQDQFAKKHGYTKIAIATVVRNEDDPRQPDGYVSSDPVWKNFGFEKTSIEFDFPWPTVQEDGHVAEANNPMLYWVKTL